MKLWFFGLSILLSLCVNAQDTATLLEPGVETSGTVTLDRWVYYVYTVPAGAGWNIQVIHGKRHDLDVYIKKGTQFPTRVAGGYDYKDTDVSPNVTISSVSYESTSTTYTVGVFGFKGRRVIFTIKLTVTDGCPSDCNSHGTCYQHTCVCNAGYYGTACEIQYTQISQDSTYNKQLSAREWAFYSIGIFSANNIIVTVNQAQGDVDLYIRHQNLPDFLTYDYADFSKSKDQKTFNLSIVQPQLGTWYLGFYGFSNTTFSFKVSETRSCPMQCSNHGSCVGSRCNCKTEFVGLSCEEKRDPLELNSVQSGFVDENYWNWYRYTSSSMNPFAIIVTHSRVQNCDIFVNDVYKPTTTDYLYSNSSTLPQTEIVIYQPFWFTWYIGVYGTTPCQYNLTIEERNPEVTCYCVHGKCAEDGRCICDPGYSGVMCDEVSNVLSNNKAIDPTTVFGTEWKYYEINVTNSSQLVVVSEELYTKGMIWLYVAAERYPTLFDYDASDASSKSSSHRIILDFNTAITHKYYIGVYGGPFITERVLSFVLQAWYPSF